ncbi:BAK1 [Branchiostoma lanceolatum]|uniref:Bcl-2 homologous antagonist/killer n=1 Tax=Branchiostoma lanceolatum TaxID=7740 RepID=A0A8J9ZB33_BRALA|nr:BAK1 [Branchiostoma lanceolatum]CAH1251253.1 BAK1 [Branchiostoma lanceolatum]
MSEVQSEEKKDPPAAEPGAVTGHHIVPPPGHHVATPADHHAPAHHGYTHGNTDHHGIIDHHGNLDHHGNIDHHGNGHGSSAPGHFLYGSGQNILTDIPGLGGDEAEPQREEEQQTQQPAAASPGEEQRQAEEPLVRSPQETEENVAAQTESVVRDFLFQRHQREQARESQVGECTPSMPELTPDLNPLSRESEVGRKLAMIGDEIENRYESEFKAMIKTLRVTPSTAYEAFAGVARRLFRDGINWGRIAALLCFGYRMAVDVLERGIPDFVRQIIKYVVQFIISERIARWIAEHGGWRGVLSYTLNEGFQALGTVFVVAAVTVIAAVWLFRRS